MTATELRIGNLLDWYGEIVKVTRIYIDGITDEHNQNIVLDNLNPILLTEEWLMKAGAEKYEFDNGQPNQYRIENRLFVIRDGFIVDYATSVVLKYVHQLQNFIFVLTKKELITK